MKFTSAAVAALSTGAVLAAPTQFQKRAGPTDDQILNYALTLEHLEATFYREALQKYSKQDFAKAGFGDVFYSNLNTIAGDEATHVSFLTGALQAGGYNATAECTYSFPYNNPKQFVALASILEGVGVSAYLGAAASIANKNYLTAAGSILTVEARHNAYIRQKIGEVPFAYPFDTPLDFDEVYTLAAPFIKSCPPTNPTLPVMAFPSLSVLNQTRPAVAGDKIYLITAGGTVLPANTNAAWASVTGPIFTPVTLSTNKQSAWTTIPAGVGGQSYVVLVKGNSAVTDSNIIAGPAIVETTD